MIYILMLIPLFAHSTSISLSSAGGGRESLIGGTGLAWLGSPGSLSSNPALLGWLPKKKQFISSNQLRYFRPGREDATVSVGGTEGGASYDVKLEVLPVYAATTEHTGEFGYGYGLSIDEVSATLSATVGTTRTVSDSNQQSISLAAGAGKKFSEHALGLSLEAGRLASESDTVFFGEDGGVDFLGSSRENFSEYAALACLGWAYEREGWSLGASSRFSFAHLGGHARNRVTFLSEVSGTVIQNTDHKRSPLNIIPVHGFGGRYLVGDHVLFADYRYAPSYNDPEDEGIVGSQSEYSVAMVTKHGARWKTYLHSTYLPGTRKSRASDDEDSLALSAGASRAGDHSVNYGGLTLSQGLGGFPDRLILVTFGTQFDY